MKIFKTFLIFTFILSFIQNTVNAQSVVVGCYVQSESKVYISRKGQSTNFDRTVVNPSLNVCNNASNSDEGAIIEYFTGETCTIVGTGNAVQGEIIEYRTVLCPIDDYIQR